MEKLVFGNLLDSHAYAIRPAIDQDSAEGTTQDFNLPTDTVPGNATRLFNRRPCSYQEAPGRMSQFYAQRDIMVSNVVYFDQDPGDLANCRLVVTRPATGDVIYLNVMGCQDPIQWGASWVWPVATERIRQPA